MFYTITLTLYVMCMIDCGKMVLVNHVQKLFCQQNFLYVSYSTFPICIACVTSLKTSKIFYARTNCRWISEGENFYVSKKANNRSNLARISNKYYNYSNDTTTLGDHTLLSTEPNLSFKGTKFLRVIVNIIKVHNNLFSVKNLSKRKTFLSS